MYNVYEWVVIAFGVIDATIAKAIIYWLLTLFSM